MSRYADTSTKSQLAMPGMPSIPRPATALGCCNLTPGQKVTYLGKVAGGPRFGLRGVVTKTLRSRAVVDMGGFGTWNIPYYFLSDEVAA